MQNVTIEDKMLPELFPEIKDNDIVKKYFGSARIRGINLYKKSRKLEIQIISDNLIPAEALENLERTLRMIFKLEQVYVKVFFNVNFPIEKLIAKYWKSIMYMVKKKIALCRGIMDGCIWCIKDKRLQIQLKTKGCEILKSKKCDSLIEKILEDSFGIKIRVEFIDCMINEEVINEYIEFRENQEAKVVTDTVINNIQNEIKAAESSKSYVSNTKAGNSEIILGKSFNDSIMKMSEVTQDSGRVSICGDIIRTEERTLNSGKTLYIFDITDYTGSITVKIFLDKSKHGNVIERLKENVSVKVRGEAQYDKFSKELTVIASDIIQVQKNTKKDNAAKKRVELHLHTQMSAMDGVTSVKALVKRAHEWGHKAIAITDHGVVQAYPDACDAGKKHGIKIIYGIEAYLLDDAVPIVYYANGHSIDGDFVVFDIETTGLQADKDKITEIGAVKLRNGKVVDTYNAFVNPQIPIPEFIVKLTGITDEMVAEAPTIESVLPKFLEFSKGAVLVAHNASFDIGFIRHNARLLGIDLENPVVDTLELSRQMFPELSKHKLNIVAKHLGVELKNHHRALDDAMACAGIFTKCIDILKGKNVKTIDDIDNTFGDCENSYKSHSTYHAIILVKN